MIRFEVEKLRRTERIYRIEAIDENTPVGDLTYKLPKFTTYENPAQLLSWNIFPELRNDLPIDDYPPVDLELFKQFSRRLGGAAPVSYRIIDEGSKSFLSKHISAADLSPSGIIVFTDDIPEDLPVGRLLNNAGFDPYRLQVRFNPSHQILAATLRASAPNRNAYNYVQIQD